MEEKKIDRRIVKTKRAIRNAFAELLSVKNINDINVKEIAEAADINRKTFYNYYEGIYQIVDEIEDEIVSSFEETLCSYDYQSIAKNPYIIFERLTMIISKDMDFYSNLLKMNSNAGLVSKIKRSIKTKVLEWMKGDNLLTEYQKEVSVDYMVSGMLSVYQKWFNSERTMSIDSLANDVGVLVFEGINGLRKKKQD